MAIMLVKFSNALLLCIALFVGSAAAVKRLPPSDVHTSRQLSGYRYQPLQKKREWSKPDYTMYHDKDASIRKVFEIVESNPSIMSVETKKASDAGYDAQFEVVTVEPGGLSDASTHKDKTRVFINFGQHARELITVEVALRLLELLAQPVDSLARQFSKSAEDRVVLKRALSNMVLLIIPMENQNGRTKVERGDLCERKNGRGVDTNRNWPVDWGVKERDYDPSEEYPGTRPLSEPEAHLIEQLLTHFEPHAWVNMHSGMKALFMPYDHIANIPDGDNAARMYDILNNLNRMHCKNKCAVGSGGKSVGYLAHGTATDYIFERLHIAMVFTWEIYGNEKANYHDCFNMFNPLTQEGYEEELSNWSAAFFSLFVLMDDHPALPGRAGASGAYTRQFTPAPTFPKRIPGQVIRGSQGSLPSARPLPTPSHQQTYQLPSNVHQMAPADIQQRHSDQLARLQAGRMNNPVMHKVSTPMYGKEDKPLPKQVVPGDKSTPYLQVKVLGVFVMGTGIGLWASGGLRMSDLLAAVAGRRRRSRSEIPL